MTEQDDPTTGSVRTTAHPRIVHRQRQEGGSPQRPGPSLRQPRRRVPLRTYAASSVAVLLRVCCPRALVRPLAMARLTGS
jgi:hypothetical protein